MTSQDVAYGWCIDEDGGGGRRLEEWGGELREVGEERVGSGIPLEQEPGGIEKKLQQCVFFCDRRIEQRSMNQITMEEVGVGPGVKGIGGGRFISPQPLLPVFLWCSSDMQDRLMQSSHKV